MDFSSLPLFGAIARKMSWLNDRQKVLSENIANTDTPRYRASDLRPLSFSKTLAAENGRLQLAGTEGGRLIPASFTQNPRLDGAQQPNDERAIDGNTVSVEDELIKMSDTAADYQLMTNLYRKQIGMLKEAIGHGSSGSAG